MMALTNALVMLDFRDTIVCTDDDIVVSSDGADKKKGTADDVSVPKVASSEEGG